MKKTIALINQLFINVFQNTMKTVMFFFHIYIKFVNNIHFLIANIQRNILQYIKINDTKMNRKIISTLHSRFTSNSISLPNRHHSVPKGSEADRNSSGFLDGKHALRLISYFHTWTQRRGKSMPKKSKKSQRHCVLTYPRYLSCAFRRVVLLCDGSIFSLMPLKSQLFVRRSRGSGGAFNGRVQQ